MARHRFSGELTDMASLKWDAELYDSKHAFVWEKARGLVEWLAPQDGERILDIGCGTGQLSAEIAASGALVVGVDRSPDMVDEARKKFPGLRFEVRDARALEFREEFDAVFCGKGNVEHVVAALQQGLSRLGIAGEGANPWYYPGIAEYSSLLERHGLEVRQATLFHRPTRLEDGETGLANWIGMFCGTFVERVGREHRADYLRAVEAAARQTLWKGDHWELDYRRLRLSATKAASPGSGR